MLERIELIFAYDEPAAPPSSFCSYADLVPQGRRQRLDMSAPVAPAQGAAHVQPEGEFHEVAAVSVTNTQRRI